MDADSMLLIRLLLPLLIPTGTNATTLVFLEGNSRLQEKSCRSASCTYLSYHFHSFYSAMCTVLLLWHGIESRMRKWVAGKILVSATEPQYQCTWSTRRSLFLVPQQCHTLEFLAVKDEFQAVWQWNKVTLEALWTYKTWASKGPIDGWHELSGCNGWVLMARLITHVREPSIAWITGNSLAGLL